MLTFFINNTPSWEELLWWLPPFMLWAYGCLWAAGYLKCAQHFKTGYTRKIFHLLIFVSAALIQTFFGLRILCLLGIATSVIVFYALIQGSGHLLYEAIAREKDAPHRTYYIIIPYCATLIGGITSNILFAHCAVVGYLVTGLGDAIGEPVGTRFGYHTYQVPWRGKVASTRSYEGSCAVFVVSLLAVMIAVNFLFKFELTSQSFLFSLLIAFISAIVEAISPHGWDNALLQIVPSFCAAVLL